MNTLENQREADEESVLPPVSRRMKIVMAAIVALGILDGYQDYVMYSDGNAPVAKVQKQ